MLRAVLGSFVVGLAGAVTAAACSGPANLFQNDGGTEGGTGGHPVDGGTACSDFAAAKCAKFDSCTDDRYTPVRYGGPGACQMREELSCLGILAALDTTATAAGFEQCGKDLASAACVDFFDLSNQSPACTPQVGSRANGRSCVNNGQCQSTWCYAATTAVCGVCATRPAAGAACKANVDCGGDGMLCSTAYTCGPAAAVGGSCTSSSPCGYGLSCVGATASAPGACQAEGTMTGAACDAKLSVAPYCSHDDGLYCPSATDTCVAAIIEDAGGPCGITPGMVIAGHDASTPSTSKICTAGAACEPSTAPVGTCMAPAADGTACDTITGPPCLLPARCVSLVDASPSGTCAILETTKACD